MGIFGFPPVVGKSSLRAATIPRADAIEGDRNLAQFPGQGAIRIQLDKMGGSTMIALVNAPGDDLQGGRGPTGLLCQGEAEFRLAPDRVVVDVHAGVGGHGTPGRQGQRVDLRQLAIVPPVRAIQISEDRGQGQDVGTGGTRGAADDIPGHVFG
jgi:hypothetical protein